MKINSILFSISFIVFFLFTSHVSGQSKFEYGIGIGINHSKIDEQISTLTGSQSDSYKVLRLPAVSTRIAYKLNEKFHINSGAGFSWLGSLKRDLSKRVIASTVEVPLQLEWNVNRNFHITTGPVYNYTVGLTDETETSKIDILPIVNSKHQFGLKHGIGYSHESLEFTLSYSHYMTDLLVLPVFDVNGNEIGTLFSKLSNIQLGIIFRR
ncbi:MAG: hypothetical protein P1U56_08980 [Saprospiraceae bacterium]|nr:hypothetical protein [Saprospiraceae bacterium]